MSEDDERKTRRHRRVTTQPAPGSDPAPALPPRAEHPEESSERSDSNDERLKRDVPPHW
ncbi:hypothetical protein [Gryllotalpicola protaetiae]|uniref:hypothetical protein n=1 Tax=Gryllotalpicola protaetiae TaxID=2419771 RepID=UPI0013C4BF16|nr:hypothetical protein [Gryllotalpicola protaetiae]